MLKITGIIFLITATSTVGMIMSKQLDMRVKLLQLIRQMLEDISIQLRFKASTVYEILEYLDNNPVYNQLGFLYTANLNKDSFKSFSEIWSESIDGWVCSPLKKEDFSLLNSIGSSLGTSDIEGQLSSLELFKEKAKMHFESASSERDKKLKLYRSLGVLSGIFVSVMIV